MKPNLHRSCVLLGAIQLDGQRLALPLQLGTAQLGLVQLRAQLGALPVQLGDDCQLW